MLPSRFWLKFSISNRALPIARAKRHRKLNEMRRKTVRGSRLSWSGNPREEAMRRRTT